jgi:hypothetical protein
MNKEQEKLLAELVELKRKEQEKQRNDEITKGVFAIPQLILGIIMIIFGLSVFLK